MLDALLPLTPAHFFAFQCLWQYTADGKLEKKHKLVDLTSFHGDYPFAEVFCGWNLKGLYFEIKIPTPFSNPEFPNFQQGDSVELFIDTRDVKTTGFTTRFSHHFYFFPQAFQTNGEKILAGEATRFRTEDSHKLCDEKLLTVASSKSKKLCIVQIFIPKECLYGYDPAQFDRLGFTYRINRIDGSKQFFSANDADFSLESQPSLWASIKLVK